MLDPRMAELGSGDMLTGGGIPELHFPVLPAAGEQVGRVIPNPPQFVARGIARRVGDNAPYPRRPRDHIRAIAMPGEHVARRAVGRCEQSDRAGGGCRRERLPVGRPAKVDHIIVERRGPVLGELHVRIVLVLRSLSRSRCR